MTLQERLDRKKAEARARLDAANRRALDEAVERLRMLQVVENGLAVGDVLPDFALPDAAGRIVTSDDIFASGPLVLVFFRGPWCPYCSLTLEALEAVRPRIEALGASLIGVVPLSPEALARLRIERRLGLRLLSDIDLRYAGICGVRFQMTTDVKRLYLQLRAARGLEIPSLDDASPWELPIPATYVADRDGVIHFAFGDADWARRAEPEEIVATLERLVQEAAATA